MTKIRILIATVVVTLAAASIAVSHQTTATCGKYGRGGENVIAVTPDERAQLIYADRVNVGPPNMLAFWIYLESNGHAGLQTEAGQESAVAGDFSREDCTISSGHANVTKPDTFIF